MENEYIISGSELAELLTAYYELEALEQGGVDNWDWYGASISDWEEQYGSVEDCAKSELEKYRKVGSDV